MKPERITVHCAATPDGKAVSVEAIKKDHFAKGYGGIGYHAIIQPDGEIVWTRGLNEVAAHVAKHNTGNIGLCLAGSQKFGRAQLIALSRLIHSICGIYDIPPWEIYCHYEWDTAQAQKKSCPNIDVKRLHAFVWLERDDALKPYFLEEVP